MFIPQNRLALAIFNYFCLGKKYLVLNMVGRNLKVKYRKSVLGVLWTLFSPLSMALTYYLVFHKILNVQIEHYLVFILCGIFPWQFFSQTLSEGMESIVGNWGLVSKIPVQLQVFPFVGAATNFVTLTLSLPILAAVVSLTRAEIGLSIILFPVYMICLFFITYSLSLILSIAFVYFRDLRHIMSIVLQLWFYATPVLYDENMIPERFRILLTLNPLGHLFTGLHDLFVRSTWPPLEHLVVTLSWTVVLFASSLWILQTKARGIVEKI